MDCHVAYAPRNDEERGNDDGEKRDKVVKGEIEGEEER